jgi:hypothetical protein
LWLLGYFEQILVAGFFKRNSLAQDIFALLRGCKKEGNPRVVYVIFAPIDSR